jgi:hypothetical protein
MDTRAATRPREAPTEFLRLSDGEVHYVWWFVQGSIMEVDTRWRLRRGWGMCQRHAWGALAAEAAFRQNYFHGPAILYEDLLDRAVHALEVAGPWSALRVARRLRATGPCLMCEMGFDQRSRGAFNQGRIDQGRNLAWIREFGRVTRTYWNATVCGRCVGSTSAVRCRPHLLDDERAGVLTDLESHQTYLAGILEPLRAFARSYRWEHRGTGTDRDRAALLSAVGWCSGWQAGLGLLEDAERLGGA